jgi:hypothetical protein
MVKVRKRLEILEAHQLDDALQLPAWFEKHGMRFHHITPGAGEPRPFLRIYDRGWRGPQDAFAGDWLVRLDREGEVLVWTPEEFHQRYELPLNAQFEDVLQQAREQLADIAHAGDDMAALGAQLEAEDLARRLFRPFLEWALQANTRALDVATFIKGYVHVAAYMALCVNRWTRTDEELTDGLVNLTELIRREALTIRSLDDAEGFEVKDMLARADEFVTDQKPDAEDMLPAALAPTIN